MSSKTTLKYGIVPVLFALLASPLARAASPAPVYAQEALVVSASPLASEAGAEVMRQGGNAFDAAAAVGFVLAVTWPEAGNLGGGGFLVSVTADGTALTLDFREKAPSHAGKNLFLDEDGEVIRDVSLHSPLASGVPGSVDGLLRIWRDHGSGRVSRRELLAPAIRLARDGFIISRELAQTLNAKRELFANNAAAARIFVREDGRPWQAGDLLVQPELATTLSRIARSGREGFYEGPVADLIALQQAATGGLITRDDLASYESKYRDPVRGSYQDYEIVSMGPPSSGGVLVVQMLNMLAAFPVEELGWGSSRYVHLLTEIERRAYADRAEYLGDSDFFPVPVETLTSPGYAADRAATISMERATPSDEVSAGSIEIHESPQTTHYSIVDAEGNAVGVTTTLNASFGSGIVIDGAGFFMNNEMDDFVAKPGVPNLYGLVGGEANAIAPGKRMLSSMSPTVVTRDGKPAMVLGSPGGSTIITTVMQVFLNVAVHDMDIQEAVNAPRHHHQWLPDRIMYEERAFPADVREALEAMGHTLADAPRTIGAANCIRIGEDGLYGAPDPRRQSAAAGY